MRGSLILFNMVHTMFRIRYEKYMITSMLLFKTIVGELTNYFPHSSLYCNKNFVQVISVCNRNR